MYHMALYLLTLKNENIKHSLVLIFYWKKILIHNKFQNSNGFICAEEFQSALTNGMEDFPFQIGTVRAMMSAFNLENQQELNFEKFVSIWKYVIQGAYYYYTVIQKARSCLEIDFDV